MNKKRRAQSPLFAFFKMLISPIMGWKNIKSVAYKPEEVASRLYYPLVALIAAGEFLQLIYNPDLIEYVEEDYALCFKKDSDLVEKVNKAIAELKEDGTFDAIIDKYIGGEK